MRRELGEVRHRLEPDGARWITRIDESEDVAGNQHLVASGDGAQGRDVRDGQEAVSR
ncbi:MAG: hypothetical protein AMXMBFR64_42080 [Myxococcales bacterium]